MAKKSQKKIEEPLSKTKIPHQLSGGGEKIKKTKIRVIGIGGGGGNIVSEIALRVKKPTFVVANTDIKALKGNIRKAIRFQFGNALTGGLGTGMNAELGMTAAQNDKEKIKKILEGQDLCIIIACLGGGVGSGAAPVFAKISKSLGNLTYGIFTLPFKFEGEKKMEIARVSLEKSKPKLNALSLIPNERIFQVIDKTTPLKEALSAINKSLAESLEGLIETIYEPGLINIDFADLKTILEGRGRLAYLNTVMVPREEGFLPETIEKLLNSPLYPYTVRGAKGVLFNIAGKKSLGLSEVNQISKTISDLLNKKAKIIFGISQTRPRGGYPKYADIIKTTLLASGCGPRKIFPSKPRLRPAKGGPLKRRRKKIIPKPSPPRKPTKKSKIKKVKIEVSKKSEEPVSSQPEVEEKKATVSNFSEEKIRKSALQIKKEAEEAEKEMIEKEKFWETPAFLCRRRLIQ